MKTRGFVAELSCRTNRLMSACVVSVTIAGGVAEAGIVTYGSISVEGTGTDSEGEFDPSLLSRSALIESDSSLHATDSLVSYIGELPWFPNVNGLAPYESAAGIRSSSGELGASAEAGRFGRAAAAVFWKDSFQLLPPSSGSAPSIEGLYFWVDFHGTLATTATDGGSSAAWAIADFNGHRIEESIQSVSVNLDDSGFNFSSESNFAPIDTRVARLVDLTDGSGNIEYGLEVGSSSFRGSATSNFFGTMKLAAITLADGSTPESHGYTIVFESGMTSPNVSAVPEPASMALAGIGAFGLGIVRAARRRRHGNQSQTVA